MESTAVLILKSCLCFLRLAFLSPSWWKYWCISLNITWIIIDLHTSECPFWEWPHFGPLWNLFNLIMWFQSVVCRAAQSAGWWGSHGSELNALVSGSSYTQAGRGGFGPSSWIWVISYFSLSTSIFLFETVHVSRCFYIQDKFLLRSSLNETSVAAIDFYTLNVNFSLS